MNRGHAPTPELVEPNGGCGGNNHRRGHGCGCGGIPFNLENTPPRAKDHAEENEQNEENLPPPPPPPNLAEVMAQQTQLLVALVEGANHRQGGQQNDFQRKLEGFLKLRPPTYDGTDLDSLVADDWLKKMEKKLDLTTFTNDECVGAAAHQLTGAACTWWDSFSDSHEFTKSFIEYHIPKGIMEAKAEEFHNIKMGKDRVTEYTTRFTNLLRYAPSYVVNSKKEKLYYYRKGLNPHIKLKFGGIESRTLRNLVDRCI
jgi:hypothetical protein